MQNMNKKKLLLSTALVFLFASQLINCRTGDENFYIRNVLPANTSIAILIEGENDLKNAVFTEFMKAGYRVKAMNANDFYTIADVFEIKNFKKTNVLSNAAKEDSEAAAIAADKMYDNIYKLHLYNFENEKADVLQQIRLKYKTDYILLIQMKEWQEGYSWARGIQLDTMDLFYVHNYPTGRSDTVQTIVGRVIKTISTGSP